MTRFELVRVLLSLTRGRFSGLPKTRSWAATRIEIEASHPIAVEADGEVFTSSSVVFRILPAVLNCCP